MTGDDGQAPRETPADAARKRRLAEALRENLKRRKNQTRERRRSGHPRDTDIDTEPACPADATREIREAGSQNE